jgi:hypothetical protein
VAFSTILLALLAFFAVLPGNLIVSQHPPWELKAVAEAIAIQQGAAAGLAVVSHR